MKNKKLLKIKATLITLFILGIAFATSHIPVQASEGDVWISPSTQNLGAGENFDVEVHMDTGGKDVGAFNMYFDFYTDNIAINSDQGDNGVSKGSDVSSYSMLVNSGDIENGHLRFGGITASGYVNGSDVHLATIHARTTGLFASGTASLSLRVNELSDSLGSSIESGSISGATIVYEGDSPVYSLTNFTALKLNWLGSGDEESDINGDQSVNSRDLGIMMSNWEN